MTDKNPLGPTLSPAELVEMISELDKRLLAAQEELAARRLHSDRARRSFHLVTLETRTQQVGQMVIVANGDTFLLGVSSPTNAYHFDTFARAKAAQQRWNKHLDKAQRDAGCGVFPVSRDQYLEYVQERGNELRPLLVRALERMSAVKH